MIMPDAGAAASRDLVAYLKERLRAGKDFNNDRLTEAARNHFGGSRGAGYYTPRDSYDAMEAAANQLLLEDHAADLMRSPVTEALEFLRLFAARLPTQTDRTEEQVEFQQFSSPTALAFIAARLLAPQPPDIILEPSAGTGSLAIWPRAIGARVICNEIAERRRGLLELLGFEAFAVDAEFLDDLLPAEIAPNGILMNPPFSSTGGRVARNDPIYGARHIESALRRLERGGRLVAISSAAMAMQASKFSEWWRRIAKQYNVRANMTVSGREYAKQGTSVDVQLIVIDKDGATPGADWAAQLGNIVWDKTESLEEAWERLKELTERAPRSEAEEAEAAPPEMFVPYEVARLCGGAEHPAVIVESAAMASIEPPAITYRPHLPQRIAEDGLLSRIQIERVMYAGQCHEQRMLDGARGGFFIGDGTGLGKGRELAAIIADNWNQGRKRALWLSVNNDLLSATKRDLTDIGYGHIPLARINDYAAAGEITLPRGVVFASYSSLISESKDGKRRLDQIQRWLGREGLIITDESSKAKNAISAGYGGEPTQTGQAVVDLQSAERNPDYRIVYASATGATEVRNMAYMTRLGLWGEGTSFPSGFAQFMNEVEEGGMGAMEMVARDLKARGKYLSGSISFGVCPESGLAVEYREVIHHLTTEQREMYDRAATAWQYVQGRIDEAVEVTGASRHTRARAMNRFWGDHQRFFRQVICAIKVPTLLQEVERGLEAGQAVVISLVGTGEARTRDQVAKAVADGGALDDLDFTPREVLAQMIDRAFPTIQYRDVTSFVTGQTYQEPMEDVDGNPLESREALRIKQELLDGLASLNLPENPLDQIVNYFGESKVAELTGRKRRLIRDERTGKATYKKRAPAGVAMDRVNLHEMEEFQAGRKLVAIISDAASFGISLHASKRCANRRRRLHVALELGWSADKQLQVFGRTHRTDQACPPIYMLLSTELGGERRFSSTIAKRLASLGALTRGERRAADASDLAKYNFETEEGRAALAFFFRSIMRGELVEGLSDARQTLRDMGLLVKDKEGAENIRTEDERNITRFLNRVLALDVARQNAVFNQFSMLFDRTIAAAKEHGTFDEGVTDIRALAVRVARAPRVIALDPITGAKTTHYMLEVDYSTHTISFNEAEEERKERGGQYYRHIKKGHIILAVPSRHHTDPDSGAGYQSFAIWTPKEDRAEYRRDTEFKTFKPIDPEEAREGWTEEYAATPAIATEVMHVIGGAILPLWRRLKAAEGARLRIVRVAVSGGQRIVGAQIPPGRIGSTLRALGIGRGFKSAAELYAAVWREGEQVELADKLFLRRVNVHKEPRVEVVGVGYYQYPQFRALGLIEERIDYKPRFFVSTEEDEGVEAVARVIKLYPPVATDNEPINDADIGAIEMNAEPLIDVADWLIEPAEAPPVARPAPQKPITRSPHSHPAHRLNGSAPARVHPAVNGQRKVAAKPKRAGAQLAFGFNNAETEGERLDALSALIADIQKQKK